MVRSIDTIQVHRRSVPSGVAEPERRAHRPTAGAGGLAGAAILMVGAFFLATRPSADSVPSTPAAETQPAATTETPNSSATELGPPQLDAGQSVEHAIILDRPLASSKAQDGSTGSANPTSTDPIAAPKPDSFTTRILNGSGQSGAAVATQSQLAKLGFHITDVGTAVNAYQNSVIYFTAGHELQAKAVQSAFGHADTTVEQSQIAGPADVLLVIGTNAVTD